MSAAAKFTVSASSAVRIVARQLATGSVAPKRGTGRPALAAGGASGLSGLRIAEVADITMPDLAAELAARGVRIDPFNLSRWFIRTATAKKPAGQRARSP